MYLSANVSILGLIHSLQGYLYLNIAPLSSSILTYDWPKTQLQPRRDKFGFRATQTTAASHALHLSHPGRCICLSTFPPHLQIHRRPSRAARIRSATIAPVQLVPYRLRILHA